MRELRILDPHDFPDAPDCDGSCAAAGGPPCFLHAGLCCPDDPLDTVMVHPDVFNDDLVENLFVAAALLPPHRGWELPATAGGGGGKEVSDVNAAYVGYRDRGGDSSYDGAPWPPPAGAAAMSSDSSWTASSLETESPPPPRRLPVRAPTASDSLETESPPPSPVSRLVVPRKKRDMSVKRGKRLWSLGIPSIPASSRGNPSGGGHGGDQDGRHRKKVVVGGGVRQRLPVARPPRSRQTQRRRCTHCDSTETPQWRAGPAGPGTLCNACGIRYTMNKLLPEYRPSTSPSFQSDKHSNRHRKVVKLREKKVKVEVIDNMAPAQDRGDFEKKVKMEKIDNMAPAPDRGDFEKKVKVEKIDNMAPAADHGDFMDVCKYI